jgi:5'-3' exonuclease
MKLKVIVAALVVTAAPLCGQAQEPKAQNMKKAPQAPPVSKVAAAQKVVKSISSDKAKTQTYCDIGKLGEQIEQAEQKNDMKKIDELNKKMDELATKLGPEYVALMGELEDIDPSSKDGQDISSALSGLDKLCGK